MIEEVNGNVSVKLIDFGFAIPLKNNEKKVKDLAGTLLYLAPEKLYN